MTTDILPMFLDGPVTGRATADVVGGRFLKVSANMTSGPGLASTSEGGLISVAHADAGGAAFGVSGYDAVNGKNVQVWRGKIIVPVYAEAALSAFQEVKVGTSGKALPLTATVDPVAASVATGVIGSNTAIRWTARENGSDGNSIRVRLVDPAGASAALGVVVDGNDITVNLATNGGSALISTATQIIAAIRASIADGLVTVANESTSTGAGVAAAVAYTALAGGADESARGLVVARAVTAALINTLAYVALV